MLRPLNELSLRPIAPTGEDDEPTSILLRAGAPLATVPGLVLEGQFGDDEGRTLIVTTEDVPFEEAAHVVLLDRSHATLDHYTIGAPYAAGIVSGMACDGAAVRFAFLGETFRVRVRAATWVLPGSSPRFVRRRVPPWRPAHLKIERIA